MTTEDIIIRFLKEGNTQPEIADILRANDIHPNSLSSIEKTLKLLRKKHNATTMFQLGYVLASLQNKSTE